MSLQVYIEPVFPGAFSRPNNISLVFSSPIFAFIGLQVQQIAPFPNASPKNTKKQPRKKVPSAILQEIHLKKLIGIQGEGSRVVESKIYVII